MTSGQTTPRTPEENARAEKLAKKIMAKMKAAKPKPLPHEKPGYYDDPVRRQMLMEIMGKGGSGEYKAPPPVDTSGELKETGVVLEGGKRTTPSNEAAQKRIKKVTGKK